MEATDTNLPFYITVIYDGHSKHDEHLLQIE